MRNLFVKILFLIVFALSANAQQLTQYSQYMWNQSVQNPALAGQRQCFDVRFGYRFQWAKIEGAPLFGYLNLSGQINRKRYKYLSVYHGLGAQIERDDHGPFGTTKVNFNYAMHFPIKKNLVFSLGIYAGVIQHSLNRDKANTIDPDNAIHSSISKVLFPDLTFGIFIDGKKFYVGASYHQIIANKWKEIGYESRFVNQLTISAGYKIKFGDNWSFIPSVMGRIGFNNSIPSFDINTTFSYQNRISFGVGYRNTDAVMAMFKIRFLRIVSFGYSFDFVTSKLRHKSAHSHEITLGIKVCKGGGSKDPTNCPVFD